MLQGGRNALTAKDRSEILQLAGRYAHAIDSNDAEAWADCFTADGAFESEIQGRFTGHAELARFSKAAEKFGREMGIQARHWTNHWVIDGDGDVATATSYAMLLDAAHGGAVIGTGIYHDQLRRVSGAWKFVERKWVADGTLEPDVLAAVKAAFRAEQT